MIMSFRNSYLSAYKSLPATGGISFGIPQKNQPDSWLSQIYVDKNIKIIHFKTQFKLKPSLII